LTPFRTKNPKMQMMLTSEKSEMEENIWNTSIYILEGVYIRNADLDSICRDLARTDRYSPNSQKCRQIRDVFLALRRQKYIRLEYRSRGQDHILDSADVYLTKKGTDLLKHERPEIFRVEITESPRKRMLDFIDLTAKGYSRPAALQEIRKNQGVQV